MELQEKMFALVAEWKSGDLTKKAFLADKPVGQSKFDYWCARYNRDKSSSGLAEQNRGSDFRELFLSEAVPAETSKVLELTTRSGLHITVYG